MPTAPALLRAGLLPAAALAFAPALHAQISPALARSAAAVTPQAPGAPVNATVYLKLHNKAALDAAVAAMYQPDSKSYHQFATPDAIRQYAPTDAEMAAVKKQLAAHNLQAVATDPMNLSVRIQGSTADFQAAFGVTVNQIRTRAGTLLGAASGAPEMGGAAAGLVSAVAGLGSSVMKPHLARPVDPETGKAAAGVPLHAVASPNGVVFSGQCFYSPATRTFTSGATAAAYQGLVYGASSANTTLGTLGPCGYSPQDVYRFYGLSSVYGRGYTGKGQTIAILDAYGSPTINDDLAAFNSVYNLPASSFKVLAPTPVTGSDAGWAGETTLDVEWSHAIAPDANIVLVTAPSALNTDFQAALLYIVENRVANIVSNSWGLGELEDDPQGITTFDEILELAAFTGVSAQFSTGDTGDFAAEENGATDVSSPADSPYATAVGGTSTAYQPSGNGLIQTGWGTNLTRVDSKAGGIDNPPQVRGFQFGAGGGTSQYFAKPAYQSSLEGTGRLLPDISALADPYTGVEIIQTVGGEQDFEVIGGTSLAAPVFSAEWALLQQRFNADLGQAAPLVSQYGTNPQIVTDVLPPSTANDVAGAIRNPNGSINYYAAGSLIQPGSSSPFLSALYLPSSGSTFALSFGTDSSLAVTKGFDTVTGWGVLNMGGIFDLLGQ